MKKLIALFAASLLSVTAMAGDNKADPQKSSQATFEALDKNADQQLSKTEASADKALSGSFAALDTNADGYVSKMEFTARTKSKTEPSSTTEPRS